MLILIIKKSICSFLLATIIKSFSLKLGIFEITKGFFLINVLSTIIFNILITYIATFFFWEIFRIFENYKIIKYSEIFPNLIKLNKNSIIPPGFMLHWKLFSLRTLYVLLFTSFLEGSFLLAQNISPLVAENFITILTSLYFYIDIFLFLYYDWLNPFNDFQKISDENFLSPPLPFENIQKNYEEEIKMNNALLEQKKTIIRGFLLIHAAIFVIGSLATCEAFYMFFFK